VLPPTDRPNLWLAQSNTIREGNCFISLVIPILLSNISAESSNAAKDGIKKFQKMNEDNRAKN
jgi:hypothetical protein